MATFNFDKEMFSSLLGQSLVGGYNTIGMGDLDSDEAGNLYRFIGFLGHSIAPFDDTNVLLVKADSYGVLDAVYGASIFQHPEHGLVLKLGANEFPVEVSKSGFKVGSLEGVITFSDKPVKIIIKDKSGEEKEIEYWGATVDLMPENGDELEYKVKCSWQADKEPKPAQIKSLIKKGESIAEFFRPIPTGNGGGIESIKMQDLGEGVYKLSGFRVVTTNDYGDRFILKLEDGREVWSRGNVDIQLAGSPEGWLKQAGLGNVELIVSSCKQRKDGKWSVSCALRRTKESLNQGQTESEPTEEKELVSVGANSTKQTDIPF